MNGKTYAFLELAALPTVGAALLDPRPALVFAGDGRRVLWANEAGMRFLEEPRMGAVLKHELAAASPLARHLAKLAKLLPTESARLEMLRFNLGAGAVALPAACRRLNLPDGTSAVMAVGVVETGRESLASRAETLADAIASRDCLVAVITTEGRVLGASGGFNEVAPASAAVDELIEKVGASDARLFKRALTLDGVTRPAGIARFEAGGMPLLLLIVGPEERQVAAPASEAPSPSSAQAEPPVEVEAAAETAAEAIPLAEEPDREPAHASPAQAPIPIARFLWQVDGEVRFGFVSPELAEVVGDRNAAIVGRTWDDVARRLWLDPDGQVTRALASRASWAGIIVHWPVQDTRERVAIELSAFPMIGRGGAFGGFRGFGAIRLNDRIPDEHPTEHGAEDVPVAGPEAEAPTQPVAAAAPEPAPSGDIEEHLPEAPAPLETAAEHAAAEEPSASETESETEASEAEAAKPVASEERLSPAAPQPEPPRRPSPPLVLSEEDIDVAARRSIEEGSGAPRESRQPAEEEEEEPRPAADVVPLTRAGEPAAPESSNIVRLPSTPVRALPAERLSGTEQDAFRRIAEALGAKTIDDIERAAEEVRQRAEGGRAAPALARIEAEAAAVQPEVDARILDKLPAGIVVYRDRKMLYANRALLDLLGYDSQDEFAAAGGAEAVFPDSKGALVRPARPEDRGVLVARRRDGAGIPVEAKLHAVPWAGATALMLSVIKRDEPKPEPVTDQAILDSLVRAERRIDELQAILDTATDGIVVIDAEGLIENINRSAEALFGVEATEVIRTPFTGLLAEESRKAALDYLDGLAENGVASVLNDGREVIGKVPKGGLIPLFMTMGRLGDARKFCAVLRDITHWKNVEEELVAAKRAAETANAQKSEFLAKISHEIRTPLNAIIGFSEVMIEERFGPIGNERYRDYLRDIHVSGTHMLSLINDLLDLSKIEAGKLELTFESVAVNEVIQECVALMQPQANRERIIIRTSLAAGVPNVVADERSLRQILLNLLSNAIKFTGAGGQVIVATALEDNGEVTLRIRDTGVGMSEKEIETAMKPFRQVGARGRGRGEGTGLGLPLTKALVEANRAAFAIDSAPNQGTLVKVTFPTTRVLAG